MNIELKSSYNYHTVVVTSEDVRIAHDITYSEWENRDRKTVRTLSGCIEDREMQSLCSFTEDTAYSRVRPHDSSELIKQLFAKLPDNKAKELLNLLNEDYE